MNKGVMRSGVIGSKKKRLVKRNNTLVVVELSRVQENNSQNKKNHIRLLTCQLVDTTP